MPAGSATSRRLTHPAVLDAAVVRKPDEEAGEVPKAYVTLKPDAVSGATTPESITNWVAGRVAPTSAFASWSSSSRSRSPPPARSFAGC
jgi:acyl-coenzyme A synthetase/AMP-(fatty) acid ligase